MELLDELKRVLIRLTPELRRIVEASTNTAIDPKAIASAREHRHQSLKGTDLRIVLGHDFMLIFVRQEMQLLTTDHQVLINERLKRPKLLAILAASTTLQRWWNRLLTRLS